MEGGPLSTLPHRLRFYRITLTTATSILLSFCALYYFVFVISNGTSSSILSPCSPRDPQVIVYNRIPKAGSTTILDLLHRLSSTNAFALIRPMPYYNHTAARNAILAALSSGKRTVVCNHFNFPELLYGVGNIAYINVMRNPVDRCISWYHYSRYGDRSRHLKRGVFDEYGDAPLEDCLAKPYGELDSCFNCPPDTQTLAFCGREGGDCEVAPREVLLRQSWANIESHYFVGLTEDLNGTAAVLEGMFPRYFKGMAALSAETSPKKVSRQREQYVLPSEQARGVIARKVAIDVELYRKVEKGYNRLKTQCAW